MLQAGADEDRCGPQESLIAIVDDAKSVREGMSDLIEALGYTTAIFATAEEFLASTVLHDASVLLSDVQLPGMSGTDLQDVLRARGHRLPIIFMTAYPNDQMKTRAFKDGALGILVKPCSENLLIKFFEKAGVPAR